MAEILVRLLKEYENGDKKYPKGQLLKTDEAGADTLVAQEIAEIYTPKGDDVIKVSPHDGGLSTEDLKKTLADAVTEAMKKEKKLQPMPETKEEYAKTGGFGEFWQFAKAIHKAGPAGRSANEALVKWDKFARTKTTGYVEESDQSQGGYLVPTEFRQQLLETALETAVIRPRCMFIPMGTNSIKIPYVRDVSHSSSTHGGIIIYRPDEVGSKDISSPKFGQVQLTLHKLAGLIHCSDEILEDSPISLQPLLTRMFGEAIAWQMEEDFINGTGAGQALGILNAPCTVSVAKESAQTATTIRTANITKMFARMNPASLGNTIWLANNDTFTNLATLYITVGNAGSAVGLVQTIEKSPYQTILGRPLFLTEHCQTLGTVGDIIFADWSQYLVGGRAGASALQVASSIHLKFDYDITSFRFVMRYDGQPWWPSALTPAHSSATLSPFITLATRSS